MISSFYFFIIKNPLFWQLKIAILADFRVRYNVHCQYTRFLEFLGLLNEGFLGEACFQGVRVGFKAVKVRLPAH